MKKLLLWLIRFYRRRISPCTPPSCRFYPTCSVYAIRAIERFGAGKGTILAVWRILRCNPFCRGWIDHVPPKIEGERFLTTLGKVWRHECQNPDGSPLENETHV